MPELHYKAMADLNGRLGEDLNQLMIGVKGIDYLRPHAIHPALSGLFLQRLE